MKPTTLNYSVAVGSQQPVRLNANSGVVQVAVQTILGVGANPTYTIEGNLGIIDKDLNDWTTTLGEVLPDPDGWVVISGTTPLTGNAFIGYQDMAKFLPLSFVRVNMSAGSAGSMAFKVLQQGII